MSILIKGMDIPESCVECPVHMELCDRGYHYFLEHSELYESRADGCPISEVPPHGDLIEREKFKEVIKKNSWSNPTVPTTVNMIADLMPAIIPAEPKEET